MPPLRATCSAWRFLVALNIADDYFRARQHQSHASGELNERALQLERLVDDVLAQMTVKQAVNAS
jgi:hypothetical protein